MMSKKDQKKKYRRIVKVALDKRMMIINKRIVRSFSKKKKNLSSVFRVCKSYERLKKKISQNCESCFR